MSRADILAGSAFIRLYTKDADLKKGLAGIGQTIATGLAGAAAGVAAIGAAAIAAGGAAVKNFVDVGSAINDMSARTGASAAQLQTLGFAAKQTGASAEILEKAMRSAAKNGVPPGRFEAAGREIAGIQDPAERSRRAMELFGKSGTMLLPMFSDLTNLQRQSHALGPILSDDDVRVADALGDAFGAMIEVIKRWVNQIGLAIGKHLLEPIQTAFGVMASLQDAWQGAGKFGSGGDLLDRLAEVRRTPLSEFQQRGKAILGNAMTGGMMADEGDSGGTAAAGEKQVDILKTIQDAEQRRAALVAQYATERERYLKKELELNNALAEVNRNRVLGFISPQQAAGERQALETAQMRLRAAEAERIAKSNGKAAKAGAIDMKRPEAPTDAYDVIRRSQQNSVQVGFAGAALALGGQQGGSGPTAEMLKTAKASVKIYEKMLAELEKLNAKPGFGVTA